MAGELQLLAWTDGGRINEAEREAILRARCLLAPVVAGRGIPACEASECTASAVDVLWPDEVLACPGVMPPGFWQYEPGVPHELRMSVPRPVEWHLLEDKEPSRAPGPTGARRGRPKASGEEPC